MRALLRPNGWCWLYLCRGAEFCPGLLLRCDASSTTARQVDEGENRDVKVRVSGWRRGSSQQLAGSSLCPRPACRTAALRAERPGGQSQQKAFRHSSAGYACLEARKACVCRCADLSVYSQHRRFHSRRIYACMCVNMCVYARVYVHMVVCVSVVCAPAARCPAAASPSLPPAH